MSFTHDIRADVVKNRLYLRLVGFMTDDQAAEVAETIIQEIQKLRPGFDVINDISSLKPASPTATEHLRRAQEASARRGHGRIIRIVGKQAVTQMQWNRTLKASSQGANAEVAATLAEAERLLDAGRPTRT
jgi:hypothetical protein